VGEPAYRGLTAINHGPISQHRQVEAVAVEGDQLRTQLTNPIDEGANKICLGALADAGGPRAVEYSSPQAGVALLVRGCTRSCAEDVLGNPSPRVVRTSSSEACSMSSILAAAERSGTVSMSQTITLSSETCHTIRPKLPTLQDRVK
jgi:hypothetical protein